MVMQEALGRIAADDWPDGDYRVLMALMSRLDWENYLHIEVTELAAQMGRDRSGVSHAVTRLVKRGVLHRGPRVGRSYTYRLDLNLGWKGSQPAKRRIEKEIRERGWTVVEGGAQDYDEPTLPGL